MKIKVLGTAAAEAIPALWCECSFCQYARQAGGKELRRRTAYALDDDTLIDFGPDIHWQVHEFGIDLNRIRRILVTHAHQDHLDAIELNWRGGFFSKVSHSVDLVGSAPTLGRVMSVLAEDRGLTDLASAWLKPISAAAGEARRLDDLEYLPLAAKHAPGLNALCYVITRNGRTVFICNDTGTPDDATLQSIAPRKLDAVFIDATFGTGGNFYSHMNFDAVVEVRERLERFGLLAPGCRCFANHFSHNNMISFDELNARFLPHGIEPAYDGLEVIL